MSATHLAQIHANGPLGGAERVCGVYVRATNTTAPMLSHTLYYNNCSTIFLLTERVDCINVLNKNTTSSLSHEDAPVVYRYKS